MYTDHDLEPKPEERCPDQVTSVVMLDFSDEFGPVKALQLFAAIRTLPKLYVLSPAQDEKGWRLMLSVERTPPVERVLAKIGSMPCLVRRVSSTAVADMFKFPASQTPKLSDHHV